METKLWIALCALLVCSVYCEYDENTGLAVPLKNGSSPNITGHEQKNSNNTNSFSSNSTSGNETISVPPKPMNNNGTDSPSGPLVPHKTQTSTPAPVSNHSIVYTTSHSTIDNTTNVIFTSPTSAPETKPPPSTHTTLNHFNITASSKQSTQTGKFSPTTVPINISTAAAASPTAAPRNGSSPKPSTTHPPAVSRVQPTTSPPNIASSSKTKINPERSNIGGNTAVAPDSPAFNPLLAGLVSAFVVTAIIITLLLFLKLRRRQSGPAFRRLQEVPMDDMEETPLYSY
uniref:Uncharacterized protein n=1 Tax=Iconisemion striatum TaxID=60296 RepID=A0A1A7YHP9_9TELE